MQLKRMVCFMGVAFGLLEAGWAFAMPATLEPVVVTATRTAKPVSEVAGTVTVITAKDIAARGATFLEEVLQDAPGLHVADYGPAGSLSVASIRGSEASQVLVLLDGIRLNSPQNGQFNLSNLPVALEEIDRIEVLRGPASALYGSNALAGVIQIFTKAPEALPVTRVSWGQGRFDTRRLGVSTAYRIDRVRYRLGAADEHSDGFRENSDLARTDFQGMLGFDLPGGLDLEISAFHLNKHTGAPGKTSRPSPQARQSDKDTVTSMTLSGPVGPVYLTARGLYERRRLDYENPGGSTPVDNRHIVKTCGTELQGERKHGRHTLLLGGDYFRDELDSTVNGDREQDRGSVFGQYEVQAFPWTTLLLGLRYDVHSDFDNEFSPRAALLFSLAENTLLRLSAGRAYRAPTFNDRFWPETASAKGNPELKPETAWEYEMALEQELGEWGDGSVAGFWREAEDLIDWAPSDPDDPDSQRQPNNVAKARIYGGEAAINLRPHDFVGIGGDYTYLHPKDRKSDEFLPDRPRHQVHAYLQVGPFMDAQLRFDGRYLRFYPDPGRRHAGHLVLDVALTRTFAIAGWLDLDVSISVKNLFDKDYEVKPGYPMPPRELFVTLAAVF
jgi:vitamin B12 transporter